MFVVFLHPVCCLFNGIPNDDCGWTVFVIISVLRGIMNPVQKIFIGC
jgi:hypothetical protein